MLSNKRVERALSEAEQSFKDCWMKLMTLRGREYGKSELLNALFSFQPTLGIALYKLEVLYEAMCKEGRHLVRRRSELSPKWFDNRMHTLDVYKHTLEETVDVGKVLGDSFAWIFYKNERELLRKHQDLQPNPHPPTGVGGRGEIAFVRRFPTFGRYLVLAHSTTTFLRVGDISLVDPTDLKVAAIGELKTHVKGDTSMGIKVILVGPKPKLSLLPNAALNAEANVPQQGVALPARMLERLKRQIKRMQESFKPFDKDRLLPPTGMSMEDTHSRLTELFRRTSSQNWGNLKVDRGLLIVGAKLRGNSLFDRLTSKTGAINNRNLGRVAEGTREIVDMALQDNSIRFDWLPYPAHGRYSLLWATRPLFWWPIDSKVIEALLFKRFAAMTVYNPAFLIDDLRRFGLEVTVDKDGSMHVWKKAGERRMEVQGIAYFLGLVQAQLFPDASVATLIRKFVETAEKANFKHSATVDLDLDMHFN